MPTVEASDDLAHVRARVVQRARERARLGRSVDLERGRLARGALVNENFCARRVIDDGEPVAVEVVGLPKLGRNREVVEARARRELVAANPDPLLRLLNLRGPIAVDAQPDGRAPRRAVLDEAHPLPVEGEERRARAFEALLGEDGRVGLQLELGAHRAVGPDDAHNVRARLFAESEVDERACDELLLHEEAGAYLHLAADAEGVDALVAGGVRGARPYQLPVIILRAAPGGPQRLAVAADAEEVEPAVGVRVGDRDRARARDRFGKTQRPELSVGVAQPRARAARAGDEQVDAAVVVEVCGRQPHAARHEARGRALPAHDFCRVPARALARVREAREHAAAEQKQVELPVTVHVRDAVGDLRVKSRGEARWRNCPARSLV